MFGTLQGPSPDLAFETLYDVFYSEFRGATTFVDEKTVKQLQNQEIRLFTLKVRLFRSMHFGITRSTGDVLSCSPVGRIRNITH